MFDFSARCSAITGISYDPGPVRACLSVTSRCSIEWCSIEFGGLIEVEASFDQSYTLL